MFAKIPYYSSAIDTGAYESMFPVLKYRYDGNKSIDDIENIVKDYTRNDYAYKIELIKDKEFTTNDSTLASFTLFMGDDKDCQFKILRIRVTEKFINFEFVCPRMIPENRNMLLQLMENQDDVIRYFWNKNVKSYYNKKKRQSGIGIIQQINDRPIVELANYIYSFTEITSYTSLIKSIVGKDEYDNPAFNTDWTTNALQLNSVKEDLENVLDSLYKGNTKIIRIPFYTDKPERKDIIYGDLGWPYKEEQELLEINNQHLLKDFSDWETCLEMQFLNMGKLMMEGESHNRQGVFRFGYTFSSLIENVLIYSSVPFKSAYPLSVQSWLDLRLYEGSIACQYVLDRENNRWTLVYQPSIDFSTPSLRLLKLMSLIYKRLIKNIGENLYNSVCNVRFWDNILSVIYNNIEFPTLSWSLNMDIKLSDNLIVMHKPTGFTLMEYASKAGMLYVHNGIVNISIDIRKIPVEDDALGFSSQVTALIKEIFHLAIKYNVPTKQIQNITNFYLSRRINFSKLISLAEDFKKYLSNSVFPYITEKGDLGNNDTLRLINFYESFSSYLISVDYHSEKSQFIQLDEQEQNNISKYQKVALLCIVIINVLLGTFRLHNKEKVIGYMNGLKLTGLSSALGLSPLEAYLNAYEKENNTQLVDSIDSLLATV